MTTEVDLLSGADSIARFLGVKTRRVYHLAEKQRLPVFRLGATLCARRSTLMTWITEMENAALASGSASEVVQAPASPKVV